MLKANMATQPANTPSVYQSALVNYLICHGAAPWRSASTARWALFWRTPQRLPRRPGEIFPLASSFSRINEMEMIIDDHAVRLLRDERLNAEDIRQVVATLKITNDLERMGDLAVNLAERIVSLAEMPRVVQPPELEPMVVAVGAMVRKSLGALIFRNVVLAAEVLESDDLVDRLSRSNLRTADGHHDGTPGGSSAQPAIGLG